MGIKFLCPNGHKLHVKAFLSGKKAICPKCGVRVVVPADGQPLDDAQMEADSASSVAEAVDSHPPSAAATSSVDRAAPMSKAAGPTASPAALADPIDDAPSAVWYVRPATGGQFGPASGEIMRAWIAEGRVGASSLVWRAGWQEWRAASAIFPQLGSLLASPGVSVGPPKSVALGAAGHLADQQGSTASPVAGGLPIGQVVQSVAADVRASALEPTAIPPLAAVPRKKRHNRDVSLFASAILLLVSVILVVVLILVWRRQEAPSDTETPDSETTINTSTSSLATRRVV
jgi:uncharacterized protein DUF4339